MNNKSRQHNYIQYSDEQLKAEIITKKNLNLLAIKLSQKLNLDNLRKDQVQNFLTYVNKLNYNILNKEFKGENEIENVNNKILSLYINKLHTKKEYTNTREILKKSINSKPLGTLPEEKYANTLAKKNKEGYSETNNSEGFNNDDKKYDYSRSISELTLENLVDFTKIVNFESLWKDSYIIIDSRYRSLANTNLQEIEFNIIQNTKIKVPGSGNVYAHGETRQIVQLEIFPFSIPFVSNADNYYNKITMSIKEMLPISFEAYEDSQFHFMFNTREEGNLINLEPINKIFRFYKPVTQIGGQFTLRFGAPFAPITFNKDRLDTSFIDYLSDPIEFTFPEDHNLITGDIIYIEDFTTLNIAADNEIISTVNRVEGHLCTRIDNVKISINISGTSITSPDSNHSSCVYFGSKRIFIPMRMRYLLSETSSGI